MRVVVGLSGGVDSAVSAALLQRAGADVVGAFIKTWHPDWLEDKCSWRQERRDAMRVAAHLQIPFVTVDLEQEYKREVADYMIAEYKAGRTPNPDVMCNKEIKFGAFLRKALAMGADTIATGHYAQTSGSLQEPANFSSSPSLRGPRRRQNYSSSLRFMRAVDPSKDQSYFLWTLGQEQLSKIIFPVGHLQKSEVRGLAKQFKLPVAEKRDSQGICFLGQVDMKDFLSHYIVTKPGQVLDERGRKIGKHDGAIFYTIGQVWEKPYIVISKNVKANTITVSDKLSNLPKVSGAQTRVVKLRDINWISGQAPGKSEKLLAQIRYHGEKFACKVTGSSVVFTKPILAAPGQSLVIYDGDACLGGGVVE